MFFILSSGRSGSRTLAATLDQFTDCRCLHHPNPELIVEATEYFCGNYPKDRLAEMLRETRRPPANAQVYGEAQVQFALLIPLIDEIFRDAQFIWLIRDGRDAVASVFSRGWYDPNVDPVRWSPWHRARLQGDRTGDFNKTEWTALTRFQRCCWAWKKFNTTIETGLATMLPSRWMMVRLDRLRRSLPLVSTFLELEGGTAKVQKLNRAIQPVSYWDSWSPDQRHQFAEICADEMNRWFPEWRTAEGDWVPIEYEKPDPTPTAAVLKKRVREVVSGLARRIRCRNRT